MQASDFFLGGPVWLLAQAIIFGTLVLSVFVLIDSLLPRRRAKVAGRLREPLWMYSVAAGLYLTLVVVVQIIPGLQVAAAIVAVTTPFAFAVGIAYLLRAVFPKPEAGGESGFQPGETPDANSRDELS